MIGVDYGQSVDPGLPIHQPCTHIDCMITFFHVYTFMNQNEIIVTLCNVISCIYVCVSSMAYEVAIHVIIHMFMYGQLVVLMPLYMYVVCTSCIYPCTRQVLDQSASSLSSSFGI